MAGGVIFARAIQYESEILERQMFPWWPSKMNKKADVKQQKSPLRGSTPGHCSPYCRLLLFMIKVLLCGTEKNKVTHTLTLPGIILCKVIQTQYCGHIQNSK